MINSKKFGSKQQKKTSGEQIGGAVVFFLKAKWNNPAHLFVSFMSKHLWPEPKSRYSTTSDKLNNNWRKYFTKRSEITSDSVK